MTWLEVSGPGPPLRIQTYEEWKAEAEENWILWFWLGHFYLRALEDQRGIWR